MRYNRACLGIQFVSDTVNLSDKRIGDNCAIGEVDLIIKNISYNDKTTQIKILRSGILQKVYDELTLNKDLDEYFIATNTYSLILQSVNNLVMRDT